MVNLKGVGGRILRRMRTALSLALLAVTAVVTSLVGTPAWAPEDPWRVAARTPMPGGVSMEEAAEVAEFLQGQGYSLAPDLMFSVAQSVALASREHGLDSHLLMSVIMSESGFRTAVVSNKGAVGLMQLLPSTAEAVARRLGMDWDGATYLRDPRTNIALGTYYLRYLLDVFGDDLNLALTAYNRGPGYVRAMIATDGTAQASTDLTSEYATQIVGRLGEGSFRDAAGSWHLASRKARPSLAGRAL